MHCCILVKVDFIHLFFFLFVNCYMLLSCELFSRYVPPEQAKVVASVHASISGSSNSSTSSTPEVRPLKALLGESAPTLHLNKNTPPNQVRFLSCTQVQSTHWLTCLVFLSFQANIVHTLIWIFFLIHLLSPPVTSGEPWTNPSAAVPWQEVWPPQWLGWRHLCRPA